MVDGYTSLINEVQADHAVALFKLLEHLPFSSIVSFFTVVLIVTFFVTSSDSGSLVIDSLASGGAVQTPVWQRVFWATTEGLVAAALLLAGGLGALQTATIVSALPFAIIMLIAMVGMWRALIIEGHQEVSLTQHMQSTPGGYKSGPGFWKKRLANLVDFPPREAVERFIRTTGIQGMEKVEQELEAKGWVAEVIFDEQNLRAQFQVFQEGKLEFIYEVRLRAYAMPDFTFPEAASSIGDDQYYRAEVFLRRGGQAYDVYGYDEQDIITDILDQFEKYLHFLHISPGILPWNMAEHDDDLVGKGEIGDEDSPAPAPAAEILGKPQ